MRRVTLLAILILAATGCASGSPSPNATPPGVTSSPDTVLGKITLGQPSSDHPYFIRVQEQIAAKWGFPLAAGQRGLEKT